MYAFFQKYLLDKILFHYSGVCLDGARIARIASYLKIATIRNSNVHPNDIFAIQNSENSCYSLFLQKHGISFVGFNINTNLIFKLILYYI